MAPKYTWSGSELSITMKITSCPFRLTNKKCLPIFLDWIFSTFDWSQSEEKIFNVYILQWNFQRIHTHTPHSDTCRYIEWQAIDTEHISATPSFFAHYRWLELSARSCLMFSINNLLCESGRLRMCREFWYSSASITLPSFWNFI